jgi:hypothetical protein
MKKSDASPTALFLSGVHLGIWVAPAEVPIFIVLRGDVNDLATSSFIALISDVSKLSAFKTIAINFGSS